MTEAAATRCRRCGTTYPQGRFGVCPKCLLESDLPPALLGGTIELVDEIGRGGMGTVWKARHLRLDRLVAVKFLANGLVGQGGLVERFEHEAQVLARLAHPRIVAVHDVGTEEGRPYIVMEYVDGRPLSELLPLPPARARDIVVEVLEGLEYAHDRGVVHRDIKPENILIEPGGHVKLSDFGIARLLGPVPPRPNLTEAGRLVGTPAYMAPEALAGAAPDPRMDIFATGVVLREMVSGRLSEGGEKLPRALEGVCLRATAPDCEERYASAALMKADLEWLDLSAAPTGSGDLPPEERHWLRAVALVETLATAAVLWAFLLSVTPRVLAPGDVQPLIMLRTEPLPDGRVVSPARFETWPTLAAAATIVLAILSQGLLRRHWRQSGLDEPQPQRPVRESTTALACGIAALALYGVRRLLAPPSAFWTSYVPILGGLLEMAVLFVVWTAILEAWRTSRALTRELRLWVGLGLALLPPIVDLAEYLRVTLTPLGER
jgi:serine/threonine-protein kinase